MDEIMLAISNLEPKPKSEWKDSLLNESVGCHFKKNVSRIRFKSELQMD